MFVLILEKCNVVQDQECPMEPTEINVSPKGLAYNKWMNAEKISHCYNLTSISNVLQHKIEYPGSSYDILQTFKTCLDIKLGWLVLKPFIPYRISS